MLFNVQTPAQVLNADVMHIEVVARGHGTNAIENVLSPSRARYRTNYYVGVRQDALNSRGYGVGDLLGTLEGYVAGQADRKVGEVAVAGAANADAIHFDQSIHFVDRCQDVGAHAGRSGIEQSVDGSAGQSRTHVHDDSGDNERGHGVGITQPVQTIEATDQHQGQANHHDAGGPDVGGEVQGNGLERRAVILSRNFSESAGAPEIHRHGNKQN